MADVLVIQFANKDNMQKMNLPVYTLARTISLVFDQNRTLNARTSVAAKMWSRQDLLQGGTKLHEKHLRLTDRKITDYNMQ